MDVRHENHSLDEHTNETFPRPVPGTLYLGREFLYHNFYMPSIV